MQYSMEYVWPWLFGYTSAGCCRQSYFDSTYYVFGRFFFVFYVFGLYFIYGYGRRASSDRHAEPFTQLHAYGATSSYRHRIPTYRYLNHGSNKNLT